MAIDATDARPDQAMLYASVDGMVAALSGDEAVFQVRASGESHVMTLDVLTAMDSTRHFASMDKHIANIQQRLPQLQGQQQAINRVMQYLQQRGLIESHQQLIKRCSKTSSLADMAPPLGLCIRTCDRPQQLKALLASVLEYEGRFSRGLRYFIVDDSRSNESMRSNHGLVQEAAAQAHIDYLEPSWRKRLADHLAENYAQPAAVHRLLAPEQGKGFSGGAAWNAITLLGAGERILMLDDDFALQALRWPSASGRLGLAERLHVRAHFEADLERLRGCLVDFEQDPLAEHIALCGRSVAELLHADRVEIAPRTLEGMAWVEAHERLSSPAIKTTALGAWGDSRMDTVMWFYLLPPAHTEGLRASPSDYRALLARPLLAHGYDQFQLAQLSNFTPLALDHRQLMPPTAPLGRGEDFLFATLTRFLYPRSLSLHVPLLFKHLRPRSEHWDSPVPQAFVPWLSRFVGEYALTRLDQFEASSPELRMGALATLYRDLADSGEQRLTQVLREYLAFMRAQIIQQTQTALAAAEQGPQAWFDDAQEWVKQQAKALTGNASPRLRDFDPAADAPTCAAALAGGLSDYAEALELWPGLWNHCRGASQALLDL